MLKRLNTQCIKSVTPIFSHLKIIIIKNTRLISWLLLLFLSLMWGSSYLLIKKALIAFDAQQVACLRISISGLAFLPVFLFQFKKVNWSKLKYFILVGVTGSGLPSFLFATAQTEISSSVAGVLSSLTPLFTFIIGVLFFGVFFVKNKAIGVTVGLLGATSMMLFGKDAGISGNMWYGVLVIIGTLSYAISANTVKRHLQNTPSLIISSVSIIIIGIPAVIFLFSTSFWEVIQTHDQAMVSLGSVLILSLGGTVIASLLFYKLVQMTDALFASMVSYMIPVIALLLGMFDGEFIGMLHFVGMSLILIGIYIAGKKMA